MRSSGSRGIPPGYHECGAEGPHCVLGRVARRGHVLGLWVLVPEPPRRQPRGTFQDGAHRQQHLVRELAVHCVARAPAHKSMLSFAAFVSHQFQCEDPPDCYRHSADLLHFPAQPSR